MDDKKHKLTTKQTQTKAKNDVVIMDLEFV